MILFYQVCVQYYALETEIMKMGSVDASQAGKGSSVNYAQTSVKQPIAMDMENASMDYVYVQEDLPGSTAKKVTEICIL